MRNTTLCYIEQGRDYLMLHRVKKTVDENKDKWIGIGGKFEEGESPEDCLLREVREETGLTLKRWRYRGIVTFVSDQWGTEYMHLFTADAWEGRLRQDCDEGCWSGSTGKSCSRSPSGRGTRSSSGCWTRGRPSFPSSSATRGIGLPRQY